MTARTDVAIVGGGIAGLAHAWAAAKRGYRVTLFERDPQAVGASVRNFGMVWPIGQRSGARHATALRSREIWLEAAHAARFWAAECGSIHLAHRHDEWAVLEEFAARAGDLGYDVQLLTAAEVCRRTEAANPDRLLGGLWSPTELGVNPRQAIPALTAWLAAHPAVTLRTGTTIVGVGPGSLSTSAGETIRAGRIVVCNGSDFATLFPQVFAESGLRRCLLQMCQTGPQPGEWRIGPHLASGLTLRHYPTFEVCSSLAPLRARIARETPELDRWGIHVMASQTETGEVILGDSHDYRAPPSPFAATEVEELILRELRRVLRLKDWTLTARWQGVYAKSDRDVVYEAEPVPGVTIFNGLGGSGMTLSFGLADAFWSTGLPAVGHPTPAGTT